MTTICNVFCDDTGIMIDYYGSVAEGGGGSDKHNSGKGAILGGFGAFSKMVNIKDHGIFGSSMDK